ncbi:hypothetical protein SD960_06330 [Flavobacterium sp. MMLR14_040]|uniref:hypothetical protein n=1 Tax=Flavobacterium sp. MMLR14_040 TaxID=3093843 RepID=UPI00298F75C7|nr:hypothetical protein [Flavobacterium sp. MMLR14_040]MDW8849702.1 hypothetical protein [Flavobacterium sp. MMLR14_040]
MFRNFDGFKKDEGLGQYSSYTSYNNDLLRLVDFYGRTPFDWYRNKKTGEIIWLDGHAKIDNYSNLGHTWGKTFANGNRLLLDGDTKQITYNGDVIHNFSKKSQRFGAGIAFSDGGNNQDPSSLRRGSRDVTWIDFGGAFEALIIILGFEVKGSKSKGKGTNEGKPTYENKVDDGINAVDFGATGVKTIVGGIKKQKDETTKVNDTVEILHYGGSNNTLQKTEKLVNGKIVKVEKK